MKAQLCFASLCIGVLTSMASELPKKKCLKKVGTQAGGRLISLTQKSLMKV